MGNPRRGYHHENEPRFLPEDTHTVIVSHIGQANHILRDFSELLHIRIDESRLRGRDQYQDHREIAKYVGLIQKVLEDIAEAARLESGSEASPPVHGRSYTKAPYPVASSPKGPKASRPDPKRRKTRPSTHSHPMTLSSPSHLTATLKTSLDEIISSFMAQRPPAGELVATSEEKQQFYEAIFHKWNTSEPENCPFRVSTLSEASNISGASLMDVEPTESQARGRQSLPFQDFEGKVIVYLRHPPGRAEGDEQVYELVDALQRNLNDYKAQIIPDKVPSVVDSHILSYVTFAAWDNLVLQEFSRFNLRVAVFYSRMHLKELVKSQRDGSSDLERVAEFPQKIPEGDLLPINLRIDEFPFELPREMLDFYRPVISVREESSKSIARRNKRLVNKRCPQTADIC
ncbi:hypothetical protein MKZ38_009270 [Zalerion maritima]|uniref:Uncharacterized protein n=1 Tax=Zalerion maritima TaxID=339359 RepID=A0AAD5WM49_9PEZI|nr:hypothetical protein MKZ38_009270 [Zalerion maritima]